MKVLHIPVAQATLLVINQTLKRFYAMINGQTYLHMLASN